MFRPSKLLARGRPGVVAATLTSAFLGCEGEFNLQPTFCDDWCRPIVEAGCQRPTPRACVRDCELTRASEGCFSLQEELLGCYERGDAIVCNDNQARVAGETCQDERDALYECEAPGIGACLTQCRTLQDAQVSTLRGTPTPNVSSSDRGLPLSEDCPRLDQPCEDICWSLFTFSSSGLAQAGVEFDDSGVAVVPEDPDEDPVDLALCVEMALSGCFISSTNPDVEAPASRSIADIIADCRGVRTRDDDDDD